ncbi:hypothetical protein jhhlp_005392 [Lomentospora prolificans]|uniref:Uncharacterized protein n=1 Tax=Lomentospora prolificans TaxID=41688 RepID=A0A2N3N6S7_9PEZI|nr:hypothetical protein jhhlp_005392 [Lomentospora prolificans]
MIAEPRTSTGASWEYVGLGGTPGLGLHTSLGHSWGGAAIYALSEYGAGLRAAVGTKGFRYRSWIVAPETGL